jgi:hypothetical protein
MLEENNYRMGDYVSVMCPRRRSASIAAKFPSTLYYSLGTTYMCKNMCYTYGFFIGIEEVLGTMSVAENQCVNVMAAPQRNGCIRIRRRSCKAAGCQALSDCKQRER